MDQNSKLPSKKIDRRSNAKQKKKTIPDLIFNESLLATIRSEVPLG